MASLDLPVPHGTRWGWRHGRRVTGSHEPGRGIFIWRARDEIGEYKLGNGSTHLSKSSLPWNGGGGTPFWEEPGKPAFGAMQPLSATQFCHRKQVNDGCGCVPGRRHFSEQVVGWLGFRGVQSPGGRIGHVASFHSLPPPASLSLCEWPFCPCGHQVKTPSQPSRDLQNPGTVIIGITSR